VVTPDETAGVSLACRLTSAERSVAGAPATFSWPEALALARHRTVLRPGDVIAGPPVVVLDGIDADTVLEVEGIGTLACPR
jgi:hypothetical protein